MNISNSISTGFSRALKSWKGIVIYLVFSLILVAIVAVPFKNSLRSSFGSSMITDTLSDGFNLETFTDLGSTAKNLIVYLSSGLRFVTLIMFVTFAFLAGGLFNSLRKNAGKFNTSDFFRAGARNFWSFLVISFLFSVILIFAAGVFIGIPLSVISASESLSEKAGLIIALVSGGIFLLLIPVFLLAADYARARKVSDDIISCFGAFGFGFGQTFRKFWSSYFMMLLLIMIQIIYGTIVYFIFSGWIPSTNGGVLLFFVVFQLLLFFRLLIKSCRYASVTFLMESDHCDPFLRNEKFPETSVSL